MKPNHQELSCRFYDAPILPGSERGNNIASVRAVFLDAALAVVDIMPDGRELSLALTKLEEGCLWAIKGIARGPHV